jgi:hypothetical protein
LTCFTEFFSKSSEEIDKNCWLSLGTSIKHA